MKKGIWLATAGVACMVSGVVVAQTAPEQAASSPAGSSTEQPTSTLNTVVITANRRSQTLESVPLAVSAITGADLAVRGVNTPQDLTSTLPNVQTGLAGFTIRGIASGDDTPKGDPSTAFSMDGVFIARPQVQSLAMFDLDRVEVVRGPQGTLYGRNATSGAINAISARPVYRELSSVGWELGNYNTVRLSAMHNTQLSETSALRVSAAVNNRDGFLETRDGSKALDSRKDASARVRYLTELGEATTALVTLDYASENDTGQGHIPVSRAISKDPSQYYQNPGADGYYRLKSSGATLELNTDFDVGTLTSLTGYRYTDVDGNQLFNDAGQGPRGVEVWTNKQFSQELRLSSRGKAALQWVVGAFYFHEATGNTPSVAIPGFGKLAWDLDNTSDSIALFGQGTYSIQPDWRVIGGLRYTRDSKERNGTASGDTIFGVFASPYAAKVSYSKASWKLGIEHDLPGKVLLYADLSTGYKAGGFNDGNPQVTQNLYYNPENVLALQGGFKGRFLDNQLYVSLSAFAYNYKDLQLSSLPPTGGITTLNAGKAKVSGMELEGDWQLTRDDKVDFSFALLNAKYSEYFPGNPAVSYSGKALDRSPKGTARIGYNHDFMTSVGKFSVGLATKYSTAYVVSNYDVPLQYAQEAFWRSDANLTYYGDKNRWYVQLYGRNLEDKRQLGVYRFGTFTLTDPRQYGIRGKFNF